MGMKQQGSGLSDKIYWRNGRFGWHCYKRLAGSGPPRWGSLCGDYEISRTNGQAIERPVFEERCECCDLREQERRGWDKPGPATL